MPDETASAAASAQTDVIPSLSEIAADYDVVFCDVWGCYHNGIAPFSGAVAALRAFRAAGGTVLLLTNAPRPRAEVRRHILEVIGGPEDSFDAIVTSGDSTRSVVVSTQFGSNLYVVGPERDDTVWRDAPVRRTSLEEADAILCTGLFDDRTETPDDYADMISAGVARGLPLLCANPDIVVDRGETRIYCAGAIAERYSAAGGATHYFGKPHAPIYELARRVGAEMRPGLTDQRILCIGDGVGTDVLGAEQARLDCLFVSGGLAAGEIGGDVDHPDPQAVRAYLTARDCSPRYAIGRLR